MASQAPNGITFPGKNCCIPLERRPLGVLEYNFARTVRCFGPGRCMLFPITNCRLGFVQWRGPIRHCVFPSSEVSIINAGERWRTGHVWELVGRHLQENRPQQRQPREVVGGELGVRFLEDLEPLALRATWRNPRQRIPKRLRIS